MPVEVDIPTKPWYASWTVWFNALSIIAVLLADIVDANSGLNLPQGFVERAMQALAAINIVLRVFKTTQPINAGTSTVRATLHHPVTLEDE